MSATATMMMGGKKFVVIPAKEYGRPIAAGLNKSCWCLSGFISPDARINPRLPTAQVKLEELHAAAICGCPVAAVGFFMRFCTDIRVRNRFYF